MTYPVARALTRVSGMFGPREPIPLGGGLWSPDFHGGVDFTPTERGANIPTYAVGAGTIYGINLGAGAAGLNVMLRLDDDGSLWWYGHLSRIDVTRGERVTDGQQIGLIGATGNTTGVHLHLERHWPRIDMDTDPWPYIKDARDIDGNTSSWQTGTPPVAVGDAANLNTAPEADMIPILIADGTGRDFFTSPVTGRRVLVKDHSDFLQLQAALTAWRKEAATGGVHVRLGKYNGGTLAAYLDELAA